MPRISVVVPAYNAAGTVAATLDALLAQTEPATQIVVVDDGSKDDTREVLARYRDVVDLVFQENGGVSAARNRGVREATGDWVAFCDADDVWHPEKMRVMYAALDDRDDVDLIFHEFWTIIDGRVAETHATHSPHSMFPLFRETTVRLPQILPEHRQLDTRTVEFGMVDTWCGHAFRWLILGNFLMPSTVIMRRSAFEATGGFDSAFRYAEDTEFFLRFAKSRAMVWVDCPLTGYRREAGTLLTANMYPTMRNAARAVVRHCVDDVTVYEGPDAAWVRRAVAKRLSRLAYFCLTELKLAEAREQARMALRHEPKNARAQMVWLASFLPRPLFAAARHLREATRG